MKRILSLCLCVALMVALFCGCSEEAGAYVPTGDALDVEGDRPNSSQTPQEQNLTRVYYPELSMNPYTASDYTNRTLLPLTLSVSCVASGIGGASSLPAR